MRIEEICFLDQKGHVGIILMFKNALQLVDGIVNKLLQPLGFKWFLIQYIS